MYIETHGWRNQTAPAAHGRALYELLSQGTPDAFARSSAAQCVREELELVHAQPCSLPQTPQDLGEWMRASTRAVHAAYAQYLGERRAGAPRRYFSNRSHALYFLRAAAPTKLVDGAWLYGLLEHWRNPRFADLVRTYVEELGEGDPGSNHVLLYRSLLARHGLEQLDDLPDGLYRQGTLQLALGWNAQEFLPEIIGFNLGYEQLPLHLLITAYELNELGLDPYYFTLHATVDNADTGHARRACQAVLDTLPRLPDGGAFWARVRAGAKLADVGPGTTDVIAGFDMDSEVLRVFERKAGAGSGAHSDYCRLAGRSINEWLSVPRELPAFLRALQEAGWIRRGEPVANSRFWGLLQGARPAMFGVFSGYELQLIHDWIRGDAASADGRCYRDAGEPVEGARVPSLRASARRRQPLGEAQAGTDLLDPDLDSFKAHLAGSAADDRAQAIVEAMSPVHHWTPAGLHATRLFCEHLHP
ncbi:MAG: iron-containing redox enzyme family protein [Comamonadaceae bacterium]|nr:MAG: iron-containing redox enzyme family protein [Comamonadaceae bacterium]